MYLQMLWCPQSGLFPQEERFDPDVLVESLGADVLVESLAPVEFCNRDFTLET